MTRARRRPTPSHAPARPIGPFFAFGLDYSKKHEVAFPHSPGAIVLGGIVYDGAGAPIPDAIVEIWRRRLRRHRARAGAAHAAATTTPSPGSAAPPRPTRAATSSGRATPVPIDGKAPVLRRRRLRPRAARQAAHPHLPPRGRGLARRRPAAVLARRPRSALRSSQRARPTGYLRHDIRLQGEKETVFLDF